jgi:signal transduction histidine kinase
MTSAKAMENVEQPTALIVSDEPEFAHEIVGHWQSERTLPVFTLMSGDICRDLDPETFDIAIIGGISDGLRKSALRALVPSRKPVLLLCGEGQSPASIRGEYPGVMVLRRREGWLDALILVASQALGARQAVARAELAEHSQQLLERQATLGRYMLEMRHTLNNALTSVLGNSELLLLEPGSLSAAARSQVETIRNMAMRMHEILQRFSSIEKELRVIEQQAHGEARAKSHTAGSTS